MRCFTDIIGEKSPHLQPPHAEEEAQEAFKKNFPTLINEASTAAKKSGLPLQVMLGDEARFGRITDPKRCWAPWESDPE